MLFSPGASHLASRAWHRSTSSRAKTRMWPLLFQDCMKRHRTDYLLSWMLHAVSMPMLPPSRGIVVVWFWSQMMMMMFMIPVIIGLSVSSKFWIHMLMPEDSQHKLTRTNGYAVRFSTLPMIATFTPPVSKTKQPVGIGLWWLTLIQKIVLRCE